MNHHSGNLAILQSLITPLNEELDKAYKFAFAQQWTQASQTLHQIGNVLSLANLDEFANLALLLQQVCDKLLVGDNQSSSVQVIFAIQLLQYELNHFIVTGHDTVLLVSARIHYLQEIFFNDLDHHSTLGDAVSSERLSQKMTAPTPQMLGLEESESVSLTADELIELKSAWQNSINELRTLNENNSEYLGVLADISRGMAVSSQELPKKVWHLTYLWLSSLALNETPTPDEYVCLLSQLDELIDGQAQEEELGYVLYLENLLADVYVALGKLGVTSDEAHQFLSGLSFTLSNEAMFFPHILGMLEGMLFAFARGEVSDGVLFEIKEQLHLRGWSFYESYVQQILDDIHSANGDPELLMQLQWQINTQLQDLYTAISNTHEAIVSKIGEGIDVKEKDTAAAQKLRRVRILVEDIKYAFNDYLHNKDSEQLPESAIFEELNAIFLEMAMDSVVPLNSRVQSLFVALKEQAPTELSWAFAHAAAEGLSLYELFLDGLAKQIHDDAIIVRANEQIGVALSLINKSDDVISFERPNDDKVRYDDTGEIIPTVLTQEAFSQNALSESATIDAQEILENTNQATYDKEVVSQESNQTSDDDDKEPLVEMVEAEEISEAYLAAKAALKPDEFDFDEDIREIFVEEAEEVLEEMGGLLPVWQARPENLIPLKDIRRGFHTLKGSGRMVGAFSVGEMAWAVENMLNRVLDGNVKPTATVANFVADTATLIPVLVADFNNKVAPSVDPAIVVLKANNILAGRDINSDLSAVASKESPAANNIVTEEIAEQAEVVVLSSDDGLQSHGIVDNKTLLKNASEIEIADAMEQSSVLDIPIDNVVGMQDTINFASVIDSEAGQAEPVMMADNSEESNTTSEETIFADENEIVSDETVTFENIDDVAVSEESLIEEDVVEVGETVVFDSNEIILGHEGVESEPKTTQETDASAIPHQQENEELVIFDELINHDEIVVAEEETILFEDEPSNEIIFEDELVDEIQDTTIQIQESATEPVAVEVSEEVLATDLVADQSALPEVLVSFYEEAKQPVSSKIDKVDDDIKEIYIEEAAEVLETITPSFKEWKNTKSKETLTDVRRGFHTLKGSGRMVGAAVLGELAWSIENMLNRVLDGTVEFSSGMIALIDDVLADFPELVKIFENNGDTYPESLTLRQAVAHAYSKGLGNQFTYPLFSVDEPVEQSAQEVIVDDEIAVVQVVDVQSTDSKTLNLIQEVKAAISGVAPATPIDDEEDELCHVFIEEARELLVVVREFLADNYGKDEVAVNDNVVRVFHTLRGAKGLAPLAAVGEVGAMIEAGLQSLQRNDEFMTAKHLQALGSSVELIENYLNAYENRGEAQEKLPDDLQENKEFIEELLHEEVASQNTFDVAVLIEGIDELLDAELELESKTNQSLDEVKAYAKTVLDEIEILENRTTASRKFQRLLLSLSSAYQILHKHPERASDDTLIDAMMGGHHELTGLFDSLAGSMSLRLDDHVVSRIDNAVLDIQEFYKSEQNKAALEQEAEHSKEVEQEVVEFVAVDTDPDLLEIFLEEAAELDTAIGESFGLWRDNTKDVEALKALQRHLHTVKGGARLAGIASIGDLTHEAETIYERMVDGRLTASDGWVRVMQGVQDILSLQIEEVRQNKRSFVAKQAVAQLQAFLDASEVPEGARLILPNLSDTPVQVEQVVEESQEISDFARRQLKSWQGALPDKDILAVFLEEANDLVESSAEDFQVFRSNTGDLATLQSLQRKLHTIKGGARMVSANGFADLAHNMETVYEDLGTRRRPATRMVIGLLLSCHDWMTGAITLLRSELNPPTPTPLIEALENFSHRPDSLTEVPMVSLIEELDAIKAHEEYERSRRGGQDITRMPPSSGLFEVSEESHSSSNEMIRISAGLMERMVNLSGEAAINRARIDMSMAGLTASIEEMGVTVQRLHDQLRRMDIELEAQILAQIDDKTLLDSGEFDPLEMDQYSALNQLSKSLSESASDLLDLKATLLEKTRDGENLLLQLSRTHTELQDGLMYSRMVPFSRLTPRLQRIVRQVAGELGKQVDLQVVNADDEMDRTILERITSPLEHMLRNAIDHGVEMPSEREAKGKPRTGQVVLEVVREGSEILVRLTDDGAGIDVEAVRKKAISQGLISANDNSLSDVDIMQYIFNAGLSTTSVVTQISGRGVGMDVVRSEIQQLGGSVSVDSVRDKGSCFTMRVPLTVAVSDALVVRVADRQYAVPLVQIERVTQMPSADLLAYYQSNNATINIDGGAYRLRYLNEILSGHHFDENITTSNLMPVILVKNQAGQNLALQVDEIVGSRIEVVVKPLGRQLSQVSGISAATIMGDGSVMFILDLMALIRNARARSAVKVKTPEINKRPVILVVDDSVTVRKVTSRFLERQGFEAVVAKDGVDAIEILQDLKPDLMLLDIEMPRMDGFEVATQVRHNARLADLPIIMITSRTGEKHRERAFEIGVTDYMGKPFQENELLARINTHLSVR